jgi:hypothetical protein
MSTQLRRPIFEDIKDQRVRESIQWMYEYLIAEPMLQGKFQHFEVTTRGAVTALKIPHNLGFMPKDIIVTSQIGGTATFIYQSFTTDDIVLTTTAAMTVRFFGGSHESENV